MKKFIFRALKIVIVFLIIACFTLLTQGRYDHDTLRLKGFYLEDKNSIDVVLLGASELYADYSAGQVYDEYKVTTYPYAVEENVVDLYENEITDILNNQSPKLLVIEANFALYTDEKGKLTDTRLRRFTDSMPLTENKIETVNRYGDKDNILSYYLPFIKYHGQFNYLKNFPSNLMLDINRVSYLKGMKSYSSVKEMSKYDIEDENATEDLAPSVEEKFRNFLSYLKDNVDTKILFVRFPHAIANEHMYDRYKMSNRVGEILDEYGFEYINFERLADDLDFDYAKDFYNYEHMNVRGQKKFTSYFAKTLVDKNNLTPTELTDSQKRKWDKSVEYTDKYYDYAECCMENNEEIWVYENFAVMYQLDHFGD